MKNFSIFLFIITLFVLNISEAKAQTTQSKEVSALIKKKRAYNLEHGYGFRIQLTNGPETEVKKVRQQFEIKFPTIKTYILFESPDWKIQVGSYKTRLEADKALNEIHLKFRGAIVVPR